MTQDQAYKLAVLGERLKAKGLDLVEDAAALVVSETVDFLADSALASKGPYDDVIALVAPTIKKKLLVDVVDKIDGKDEVQG